MHITFHGATREVTGSMHLIDTEKDRILLDCGMFQGHRKVSDEKNKIMPFDARIISNIILSHAHIDHSGRIPLIVKQGFNGRIICTRPTADAAEYLLLDSAYISESDANYLNYKTLRSFLIKLKSNSKINDVKMELKTEGHKLNLIRINELMDEYSIEKVNPIYTVEDAEQSLSHFDSYPYNEPIAIGHNTTCTFYDAGHILGSAFSIIKANIDGRIYRICYTGDIGRFEKPILRNPTLQFSKEDEIIDLLIMESTYGNRVHEPVKDLKKELKKVIIETIKRDGTLLIPSFAFGRTQELIYVLHELYMEKEAPLIPIYIDSPLATKLTKVFGEHPEVYDQNTHETFLEQGKNPFWFKQITFISSVEDSMAVMHEDKPHIIIASSGMCEAGRILHHLRYKIHNEKNTILIVGYMAENTLGRRIEDKGIEYEESGRNGDPPILKFLNKIYPLKAHVKKIEGFSAHADKNELLKILFDSNLRVNKIAVVHGQEDQSISFAKFLNDKGYSAFVPRSGETITLK
ncbi:MAG: MBL fold metallo-hydrolase [Desulfobacterales bacterium]|nr:MBL fold metallo-hydrolase [Desulfobacterales bacterium]